MENKLCFDNYSLLELRKIATEIETVINKKVREEEKEAWEEFKQAYRKFRAKMPRAVLYVDYKCEDCGCWDEVEILEQLDNRFCD